jgi:hypothetical protein
VVAQAVQASEFESVVENSHPNHPERVLSSVLIWHLVTTWYQVNPFLPCRDRGSRATTVRSPPTLTVDNEVFTVEAAAKGSCGEPPGFRTLECAQYSAARVVVQL